MQGPDPDRKVLAELIEPQRLWARAEVLQRECPVPAAHGIYGWHFSTTLTPELPVDRLLYVGIAPREMRQRESTQTLRKRIRYHFRGNAYGSTLRLTLGCLLGLELRRVGSGTRLTFGPAGETSLSLWMEQHARVCWVPMTQPWRMEQQAFEQLDLPLNLAGNARHPFHPELTRLRAQARVRARELPVLRS